MSCYTNTLRGPISGTGFSHTQTRCCVPALQQPAVFWLTVNLLFVIMCQPSLWFQGMAESIKTATSVDFSFTTPLQRFVPSAEGRSMKSAVKKPPQGQHQRFSFGALNIQKSVSAITLRRRRIAMQSRFAPSSHTATVWVSSHTNTPGFLYRLSALPPISSLLLEKRGEMWYNIPAVGAGFPVAGCLSHPKHAVVL